MICVAAKIMDKYKRKTLLITFMSLMAVASIGVAISLFHANPVLSVISTAVFVGSFCLSIGPMAWMVSAELFPDFLHASAGGVGTMCSWIGNFLVGTFYPTLSKPDVMGNYTFLIFLGTLIFFVLFTKFYVPETAGKTFDEIQKEFNIDPYQPGEVVKSNVDPWAT
ncbi:hypothetical protein THRCLA_09580 [Thraustotheca clavata]|uniref:Major facilitator superfamily (MFS) profile domain-containing protein n=1 Tax=Thraustotheca clavata TaxID=74557 RepID=A0A1V9YVQ8_9STRA|nr:hypothetical protein THRCLA_09580 [Thraustotheca clavata]